MVNMERLTSEIQTALIGSKFGSIENMCDELYRIVGIKCNCYDVCIDDGADDDETEDEYIMRAGFEFEDNELYVRVYYGNVTKEIGYVDVCF